LAEGFEEIEALTVVDYVRRAGIELKTVGVTGKIVTGSHGIPVTADLLPEETTVPNMVVLPGGLPGTNYLNESEYVRSILTKCLEHGGMAAAICAAPSVLGGMGLLKGKTAICYPGFEEKLLGATISETPVVRDGAIITAKSAGVANQFAYAIISALTNQEKAEEIRNQVYDI
ncbi:MAG: DJ-1/PfpI family protein, partial [Ruminococcaceae bacterium]|nr:DJ-1/PfpI family protein [Oscillospiraceae bacterium]